MVRADFQLNWSTKHILKRATSVRTLKGSAKGYHFINDEGEEQECVGALTPAGRGLFWFELKCLAGLTKSQKHSARLLAAEVKTDIMSSDWNKSSAAELKTLFELRIKEAHAAAGAPLLY